MNARTDDWDIPAIVSGLQTLRVRSLENRQRESQPPRLPSRKVLSDIVEGLASALFPNRLGSGDLLPESVDYFVGHTLDTHLRQLQAAIRRELRFQAEQAGQEPEDCDTRAHALTRCFAHTLPRVRALLETDLEAAWRGDPAAGSVDEVLVCYPGIMAMICHRLAHELHRLGVPLIGRIIAEIAHSATGIDIHPGASIGGSFFIDHGTGVVIGETTVIGERVRLYQAVTLGAKRFPVDADGTLQKGHARHPIVEDDVVIYAGATILGRITIGKGTVIGGNVWLTRSVPPYSQISQAQVRNEEGSS